MMTPKDFADLLFDPGEHFFAGKDDVGCSIPQNLLPRERHYNRPNVKLCINPTIPGSLTRTGSTGSEPSTVAAYRSFLIDQDRGVPDNATEEEYQAAIGVQWDRLVNVEVPVSTLMESGRHGTHAIIVLKEPVIAPLYRDITRRLRLALPRPDYDHKTVSEVQIARWPGAHPPGRREQKLLWLGDRIAIADLEEWLTKMGHPFQGLPESHARQEPLLHDSDGWEFPLDDRDHRWLAEGCPSGAQPRHERLFFIVKSAVERNWSDDLIVKTISGKMPSDKPLHELLGMIRFWRYNDGQ